MAKTNGVNKSQAIRDYFKAHKKAKPQEVVDALGKKGITVSANLVTTVKSKHNTRRKAVRKVVAKGGIGIPEVKAEVKPCFPQGFLHLGLTGRFALQINEAPEDRAAAVHMNPRGDLLDHELRIHPPHQVLDGEELMFIPNGKRFW